jgi:transposase InsO family protein
MTNEESEIRRKLRVIERAEEIGSAAKAYRYYGVPKSTFYRWRQLYREQGDNGLINRKPIPGTHPNRTFDEIVEKILYLRKKYQLGPMRIMWYMARYHDLKVSDVTISRVLKRHGVSRLPRNVGRRKVHTKRYEKQVPGHHIQMDVKFLIFKAKDGRKIKRYQYTAIDDATRVRALKIYERHTQKSAINFVTYIIQKFPFRIQQIRTDRGHEFQSLFHWHVEDLGIRHVYIKARTPQLNGKVERSRRSDQQKFYQLMKYKDDVDLEAKLAEWEAFYNFVRPHGAHGGKTPYESLRGKLQ